MSGFDTLNRCYFSIPVASHGSGIQAIQQDVRRRGAPNGFKPTPIPEMAIHLVHLGELSVADMTMLGEQAKPICAAHPGFQITLEGVTGKPSAIQPRHIYMGLGEGADAVERLAQQLTPLAKIDQPSVRLLPDLGRLRIGDDRDRTALGRAAKMVRDAKVGPIPVPAVYLCRTTADASGPKLEPVAQLPLSG